MTENYVKYQRGIQYHSGQCMQCMLYALQQNQLPHDWATAVGLIQGALAKVNVG